MKIAAFILSTSLMRNKRRIDLGITFEDKSDICIEFSPAQLLMLMHQAQNAIWAHYDLVPRD